MTVAVCFRCGKIKHGAFVACPECGAKPQTEDELALSLAMTDHYFDRPTLEQMAEKTARGHPPTLDPETKKTFIDMIRGSDLLEANTWLDAVAEDDP